MDAFEKTCPHCATTSTTDVARCVCGYLFEPHAPNDPQLAVELAAGEEKLYEQYLAARAAQAARAAEAAAQTASPAARAPRV